MKRKQWTVEECKRPDEDVLMPLGRVKITGKWYSVNTTGTESLLTGKGLFLRDLTDLDDPIWYEIK